ncbi:hypothetical protein ACVBEQ_12695 [Nakamurella sp. GG22]
MGEKGNMLDTVGLADVGSGLSGGAGVAGGLGGDGSGRSETGIVGSVAKAVDHVRTMGDPGDAGVSKDVGPAGLLSSGQDEKPPSDR